MFKAKIPGFTIYFCSSPDVRRWRWKRKTGHTRDPSVPDSSTEKYDSRTQAFHHLKDLILESRKKPDQDQ